jgi:hypothetical protein
MGREEKTNGQTAIVQRPKKEKTPTFGGLFMLF